MCTIRSAKDVVYCREAPQIVLRIRPHPPLMQITSKITFIVVEESYHIPIVQHDWNALFEPI